MKNSNLRGTKFNTRKDWIKIDRPWVTAFHIASNVVIVLARKQIPNLEILEVSATHVYCGTRPSFPRTVNTNVQCLEKWVGVGEWNRNIPWSRVVLINELWTEFVWTVFVSKQVHIFWYHSIDVLVSDVNLMSVGEIDITKFRIN